jgi:hypothetical protein
LSLQIYLFHRNTYATARRSHGKFILDKGATLGKMVGDCPTFYEAIWNRISCGKKDQNPRPKLLTSARSQTVGERGRVVSLWRRLFYWRCDF